MTAYQPISDPFVSKGPITSEGKGFYPRDEVFTNVVNLLRVGDSVSLVGERKAGKTSFLNYLLTKLPTEEFIPVFIEGQFIAPQTDQIFLGWLLKKGAQAIAKANNLEQPPQVNTLTVEEKLTYLTFEEDLNRLRSYLTLNESPLRLIWLIDEIETLRSYKQTRLFSFLRPLAQLDPNFRFVVAGYDVLYTLSTHSEWSPFFSAFRHVRLEGLNPVSARQLMDDALEIMGTTIETELYRSIFQWTGQKPFYLKWILSTVAEALNQRQNDYHIAPPVLEIAKTLFLNNPELDQHFAHLWSTHTTPRQQTVLSVLVEQSGPYNHPTILKDLKQKQLIQGDPLASQHLIEDLTRLEQLGFLYERVGEYTFTSQCLKAWIKENKPLG